MLNPLLNEESLPRQEISSYVIDGQDGSGKGTVANIIAERCAQAGAHVVKIDFPAYNLPWGKYIRAFLNPQPGAPRPKLEDKMLAYALNRLETVPSILSMVKTLETMNKPINLVFDRFVTSNVLTLAYNAVNRYDKETLSPDSIKAHYNYMLEIDSTFLSLLGLENWSAWIPLVPPEETMRRMSGDSTRTNLDLHENATVQQTAAGIYRTISEIDPRIKVFDQYIPAENRHMTADEVADVIKPSLGRAEIDWMNKGYIFRLNPPQESVDTNLVNGILEKFGSDELKRDFDSYQI